MSKAKLFPYQNYKRRPLVIAIERGYALNCKGQDKIEKANENMGKFTIFINKRHTLAHIVAKGETFWVRVPLASAKTLITASDKAVEIYFVARLSKYLVGF